MSASSALGWLGLGLLPLTALIGWLLRWRSRGKTIARMRPHFFLGYCALALGLLHMSLSMDAMAGANSTGIVVGTGALIGLGAQAFVGTNLQSPGAYRIVLRRWHLWLFCIVLALGIAHTLMNGPFSQIF